ncbi:MAG: FxsA family protein [Cellvibrionaceae bacterium]|nr:FxsA family protein [Cellvibrionaceae bacterium]MCV6625085.1 FxsA family protein [Cellvibrionaceae bacterium]
MRGLFLLFIVMPVLELWLLIQVGSQIGALNTIGLVFLTAIAGTWLLRQQGLRTLLQARTKMDSGEMPAKEMAEGICLAVGGALLLTPGFVTDAIGFACLIPGIRTAILAFFMRHVQVHSVHSQGFHYQQYRQPGQGDTIDGEWERSDSAERRVIEPEPDDDKRP